MDSPSLYLNIEVFAGTNIETAAEEAIALAMRLQVTVRFLFNGVTCYAHPDSKLPELVAEFWTASTSKYERKIANPYFHRQND